MLRKKMIILGIIIIMSFLIGCSQSPTKLAITNLSSFACNNAAWNGTYFGYIGIGQAVQKDVSPGSDSVHLCAIGLWFHTVQIITINSGDSVVWTLLDSTPVYSGYSLQKEWSRCLE